MRAEFETAELDGDAVVARFDRGKRQLRGAERANRHRRISNANRVNPDRRWAFSAVAVGHEARQPVVGSEPDAAVARRRGDVDLVAGEAVDRRVVPDRPCLRIDAVHAALRPDIDAAAVVVGERARVVAGKPLRCGPLIESRTVGVFARDETQASDIGCGPQAVAAIAKHRANLSRRDTLVLGPELEPSGAVSSEAAILGEADPQCALAIFREGRWISTRGKPVVGVEDAQAAGRIPFRKTAPFVRSRSDPDVTASILVEPLDEAIGQRAATTEVLDDRRRLASRVSQPEGAGRRAQPPVAGARLQHELLPNLTAVARDRVQRQADWHEASAIEAAERTIVRGHNQPPGSVLDNGRDVGIGQSVGAAIADEAGAREAKRTGAVGANPQVAIGILGERDDPVLGKSVARVVAREPGGVEGEQRTLHRADPEDAG